MQRRWGWQHFCCWKNRPDRIWVPFERATCIWGRPWSPNICRAEISGYPSNDKREFVKIHHILLVATSKDYICILQHIIFYLLLHPKNVCIVFHQQLWRNNECMVKGSVSVYSIGKFSTWHCVLYHRDNGNGITINVPPLSSPSKVEESKQPFPVQKWLQDLMKPYLIWLWLTCLPGIRKLYMVVQLLSSLLRLREAHLATWLYWTTLLLYIAVQLNNNTVGFPSDGDGCNCNKRQ